MLLRIWCSLRGYLFALVANAIALGLTLWLSPYLEPGPYSFYVLAIGASAWFFGFGPGLFSTALAFLSINYFFTPPLYVITFTKQDDSNLLLFLMVTAIGVSLMRTQKRVEAQDRQKAAQIEVQRRLLEQREQERQQIARDLHDGPVQALTGATLALRGIILDHPAPDLAQPLEEIQAALEGQIHELRAFAGELRPPALAKFGLASALRSHLEDFQEKHAEIRVQFEDDSDGNPLPAEAGLALFRIYQECLVNIVKHAQATQVEVRLSQTPDRVHLEIQDNGVGFKASEDWLELARQGHLGMVGMRERAEALGGSLAVQSHPGQGTTVRVDVPLLANLDLATVALSPTHKN